MPIDSGLNGILWVLSLSEPVKTDVSAGVPTLEDLKDVFLDFTDDESKSRAMLKHILDELAPIMKVLASCLFFSDSC
jgi:hypothetical protein